MQAAGREAHHIDGTVLGLRRKLYAVLRCCLCARVNGSDRECGTVFARRFSDPPSCMPRSDQAISG